MNKYERFKEYLTHEFHRFKNITREFRTARCVSHLDADGICSAAIMGKILKKLDIDFRITIIKQLTEKLIKKIAREKEPLYVFTDLGSGQLDLIKRDILSDSCVLILDHHELRAYDYHPNLIHVNSHMFDIDGSSEISASGITYLFSRPILGTGEIGFALVGAIGDNQNKNGFKGLNKEIAETAIKSGKIKVSKELKIYGITSRPIHKALEYCTNPLIPDVSSDREGSIRFLTNLGIPIMNEKGKIRTLIDLSLEEKQKLVTAIILKRSKEKNPEDIIENVYFFNNAGINYDLKEFATLINACGRCNYQGVGLMICMGEVEKGLAIAEKINKAYKEKILKSLNWVYKNIDNSNRIKKLEKGMYFVGKEDVNEKFVGTICSMVLSSNLCSKNVIVGFADTEDGRVKISARAKEKSINLKKIISPIAEKLGGMGGGHDLAAGGEIPKGAEEEFINLFENCLINYGKSK